MSAYGEDEDLIEFFKTRPLITKYGVKRFDCSSGAQKTAGAISISNAKRGTFRLLNAEVLDAS
jgi:hypothetical protein